MDDALDRHELPIQSITERNEDCTATVPVHLAVMKMQPLVRVDSTLLSGNSLKTVRTWYNEDMEYYLDCLKREGYHLPWLEGYERFRDEWALTGEPDGHGFLQLQWREGEQTHTIRFIKTPVILYNQFNENGKFYTFESGWKSKGLVEYISRSMKDSDTVCMGPEKMRLYGVENEIARIREDKGIAEVMGHAFCSDYHNNMARALLLRDFAVFYLNKLLEIAKNEQAMAV